MKTKSRKKCEFGMCPYVHFPSPLDFFLDVAGHHFEGSSGKQIFTMWNLYCMYRDRELSHDLAGYLAHISPLAKAVV